jgi:hypothetical protein
MKGARMSSMKRLALMGAVALCAAGLATAERRAIPRDTADEGPPTYTNVQVVSLDVAGRTLVVRNARGVEEKMELDDNLAGFGDVKAGDRVMLTLRAGPGWTRVSSIVKSKAVPAPKGAVTTAPNPPVAPGDIRDIRRQHRMEWDGWTLTAPKQLDQ